MAKFKIALDAGHGKNTAGKRTPDDIREWTLNDAVCKEAQRILKDYDVDVIRLDDITGNTDKALSQRLATATTAKVDVCVSVHHNAAGPTATGVEVWINPKPNTYSKKLAEVVVKKMSEYTKLKNRGVKNTSSFTMTTNRDFPTILTEGGFMDGKEDTKIIRTPAYQTAYAKAIVDSLVEIYAIKKISGATTTTQATSTTTVNDTKASTASTTNIIYAKTTANLNMRKSGNTSAAIVVVIPNGTKIVVNDKSGSWWKVTYIKGTKSYIGYCSKSYLKLV